MSEDYEDLSEKELSFGYWFLTHKVLLRKILVIFLIALAVIFFAYAIYGLVIEIVINGQSFNTAMQNLPKNLVDYSGYRAVNQPKDLQIANITIITGKGEKYDLVAKIKNPNPNWALSFDYQFVTGVDEVDLNKDKSGSNPARIKKGFFLPGEDKYLMDLSVASPRRIGQARVNFTNIQWQRVVNYAAIGAEKFNFSAEGVKFIPASATEISGKLPVSQVTFQATNKSAYNYWGVGFQIILFRGGEAIGAANYISLSQLLSGETRPVTVNWFESLPDISSVQIIPEVNVLDQSVFMQITGQGGEFR